ncbi:outer membrane beta-barrel protein [Vibrio owensii]|uniref:outer membrane beta-barrel protein n=1 Tax=Vibrio owensii TaxID=696485 RepID=UPI0038CE2257
MKFKCSSLLLVALCSSAHAEPTGVPDFQNGHFYVGGRAGWAAYQDACGSGAEECEDDAFGFGLYGGYQLNDWFALEAGVTDYGESSATYPSSTNVNGQSLSVDTYGAELAAKLSYHLSPRWTLFTRLGASYQDIDKHLEGQGNQSSQDWNTMVSAGIDYRLSQRWSLRGEYQFIDGVGDSTVDQADLHFTSLGLTYHFGQSTPFVAPVIETPAPESKPYYDVITTEVSLSASSLFGFNSSTLNYTPELSSLAEQLTQYPEGNIRIVGHTDSVGSQAYNQRLSEQRAQALAEYLKRMGIAETRMSVEGQGESQPVANNETAEGRAQNRRVEVVFETTVEETQPKTDSSVIEQ